jgi:hypothetical protein
MDGLFKNTSINIRPEELLGNAENECLTSIAYLYANTQNLNTTPYNLTTDVLF